MATKQPMKYKVSPEVLALIAEAEKKRVSMLTVCRAAGVHHDTFGRWRRGERRPLLSTLHKLRDTLAELGQPRTRRARNG